MIALPASSAAIIGFVIGAFIGAAVWRSRLCTFGAIEDVLLGQDWRRMKVFGLALGIAILLTQGLVAAGMFDPTASIYMPERLALGSILIGAILFGGGMAMVGTCSFGSLVRMGGGDLRGLVTVMLLGLFAYSMQRGSLATARTAVAEALAVAMPGMTPSGMGPLSLYVFGIDLSLPLALVVAGALIAAYLRDKRLRRAKRLMTAGILLGFGVVAGWLTTQVMQDGFDPEVRTQSLTFVGPVGRALFGIILNTFNFADFGVGVVLGTVTGAFAMAKASDEFRWNAFDDHIEMRRHLAGAAMMGVGGVLAGGCTIGQGLSAGSVLAITWPITVGGMILGARLGIAHLVGERWRDIFWRRND